MVVLDQVRFQEKFEWPVRNPRFATGWTELY